MGSRELPCTGSLQQKGKYWYTVIQVTINGKRVSKWETTHLKAPNNKRRAQALLDSRKTEYNLRYMSGSGGSLDDCKIGDLQFTEYLRRWTFSQRANVSELTNRSRNQMLNNRIAHYFDGHDITLKKLSPWDIEDFYEELRSDGLKGSTLIHYHQYMKQALEDAVRKDVLDKNPMRKVDRPRKKQFTGSFYTKEEALHLMELFRGDSLYPLIVTAVYYGMRRSELLGLQWNCVDFTHNTISVEHKVFESNESGDERGLVISDELKTKTSRRTLPLIPAVRQVLECEKSEQADRRRLLGSAYSKEYLQMVFVNAEGLLFRPGYVTQHFHDVVKKSDLNVVRLHDLRHTCASLLVAEGLDMKLIQHWLGHANYSTTADIYSHLNAGAQEITAKAMAEIFG